MRRPSPLCVCIVAAALGSCGASCSSSTAGRAAEVNEAGPDVARVDARAHEAGGDVIMHERPDATARDAAVGDATARDAPSLADTGASADTGPPREAAADATFQEAHHVPFPIVPSQGGPVLSRLRLVTVTFAGYDQADHIDAFADWVVSSSWLGSVGHDYGVGLGTSVKHVVLPGPAPRTASDLDTQSLLETNLKSGVLPALPPDAGSDDGGDAGDYLYVVVYPSTTVTGSFLAGPDTCVYEGGGSFLGGYHWETAGGPYHVPYAVIPTCTSGTLVEGTSDLETALSHELIESATDPFPYTRPGWDITDPGNPWAATDGEVADLCEGKVVTEGGFTVQRIWSNAAAEGTGDPCIPASPTEVLFDVSASPTTTQLVAAGKSVTYTLTGFSSAPRPPWSLQAFAGEGAFTPTVALGASRINNGETTTLTLTVPAGTPSQSYAGVFISSYDSFTSFNDWVVAVSVP